MRSFVIKALDHAWPRQRWCHRTCLAAVILCFQIMCNGCAATSPGNPDRVPPIELGWVSAPRQPLPSQFVYLSERGDSIIPLVVQHLRQSASQQNLASLACMANSPVDIVTIGELESFEFQNLLSQVLAEFKTERQMCLPLSGRWQIVGLCPAGQGCFEWTAVGPQGAGIALLGVFTWAGSCSVSVGILCPVIQSYDLGFVTGVVMPDGRIQGLVGAGHSEEWSVTAWKYKDVRDRILVEVLSEALIGMAISYSDAISEDH